MFSLSKKSLFYNEFLYKNALTMFKFFVYRVLDVNRAANLTSKVSKLRTPCILRTNLFIRKHWQLTTADYIC